MQFNNKIYNPSQVIDVADDWGLAKHTADLNTVLAQPYCVAALPALCTEPYDFTFDPDIAKLDLSAFDLVLISDIEMRTISSIREWATTRGIKNYAITTGSRHYHEAQDGVVYRPWWCYNLMRFNQYQPTPTSTKSYMFDVLLGARRPHRDYVMLSLQHNNMLDSNIVTYRDFFRGEVVNDFSVQIAQNFPGTVLQFPYVSSGLDSNWEVREKLDKSISPFVPWKIYQNTYYSVVCETLGQGGCFFMSEKPTKAMLAQRLFVTFSTHSYLKNLQECGFETFGSVIDESYDNETLDVKRWQKAFEQVKILSQQNPQHVLEKIQPVVKHNYNHLFELQKKTRQQQQELLTYAMSK